MESNKKMNVLVLGASGAGKSTLIKAISGTEILTGVGEGQTQKIDVYESNTWPIRCIDTKGFEYNILEQWKTIKQVKKYTKEQILTNDAVDSENLGIDVVWYCIEGTARRTFSHNIELMNKATKGWKNIPVFAVITKSYSELDIPENIEQVQQAFAKSRKVNLKKIIPLVAEEYSINNEFKVEPRGIEELCIATLDCAEEAKNINENNRKRMVIEQKRYTSNALVAGATTSAVVIGAVPFNFADAALLVPLETGLTKGIFKIYGIKFSGELVTAIVGSTLITNIAKSVLKQLTDKIPVAGQVLNGTIAGIFVLVLGEAVIAATEAIYTGKLDSSQIDAVVTFIVDKIKNNSVIGTSVAYIENNVDKIQGKSAKVIFEEIKKSIDVSMKKQQ